MIVGKLVFKIIKFTLKKKHHAILKIIVSISKHNSLPEKSITQRLSCGFFPELQIEKSLMSYFY